MNGGPRPPRSGVLRRPGRHGAQSPGGGLVEAIEQARAQLAQGDAAGAHALLLQALQTCQTLGDRAGGAAVLHELGVQAGARREYGPADSLLRRAIQLRLALGDRAGWIDSVLALGQVEQARGRPAQAIDLLERALAAARQVGAPGLTARCLDGLGTLHAASGDYTGAEPYFLESLEIRTVLDDGPGQAATLFPLGTAAQARGDLFGAADYYKRCLAVQEQLGDLAGQAGTSDRLGAIYEARGRLSDAEGYFRRAGELAQRAGRTDLQAECLRHVGQVRYTLQDYAAAFESLWEAHQLAPAGSLADWIPALHDALGAETFHTVARRLAIDPATLREVLPSAPPTDGDSQFNMARLVALRLQIGPDQFAILAQQSHLEPDVVAQIEEAARNLGG